MSTDGEASAPGSGKKARTGDKRARRAARAAGGDPQDPESRGAYFDSLRQYAPAVGVETESGVFVVSTSDLHIGRHLFVKRSRPEFRALRRAVRVIKVLAGEEAVTGRVFVDVGANIGTTTVGALVEHGFGSAVSCEPEAGNHRLLRINAAMNGLDERVRCMRIAVSDRVGRANLVVPRESGGFSWIAVDSDRIEEIERRRPRNQEVGEDEELPIDVTDVEVVTLDQLVDSEVIDLGKVGMLWIDAEGHESHILGGAGSLLDRGIPIVFEFDPEGLDARGDRRRLQDIASSSYTHFVDVRRPERGAGQSRFRLRPVSDLESHAQRFLDPSNPGNHTDLLLLRLDSDQAKRGAALPDLMARHRATDATTD